MKLWQRCEIESSRNKCVTTRVAPRRRRQGAAFEGKSSSPYGRSAALAPWIFRRHERLNKTISSEWSVQMTRTLWDETPPEGKPSRPGGKTALAPREQEILRHWGAQTFLVGLCAVNRTTESMTTLKLVKFYDVRTNGRRRRRRSWKIHAARPNEQSHSG